MAMLCADEYPHLDMDKVIRMCLIHDFGETVTGDIPAFLKTEEHEQAEKEAVDALLQKLPPEFIPDIYPVDLFSECPIGRRIEIKASDPERGF